jgi:CRISPR-associated protein Cas5 subtype I-B
MKGVLLRICGPWAHFKRPETNNNPLSHDFITKTALIGIIGAVLGVHRRDMKSLFPQLSEDLKYGVKVLNAVKKESWAFTLRKAANMGEKAPKQMEFVKDLDNLVALGLVNERSSEIFDRFVAAICNSEAAFTPVLGLHNCPAELRLEKLGRFETQSGDFETYAFLPNTYQLDMEKLVTLGFGFRIGFEKIPTFQDDDFWNLPERYVEVHYPSNGNSLPALANTFQQFEDGSNWVLI